MPPHPMAHTELCTRPFLLKLTNKYFKASEEEIPPKLLQIMGQGERGYIVEQTEGVGSVRSERTSLKQ